MLRLQTESLHLRKAWEESLFEIERKRRRMGLHPCWISSTKPIPVILLDSRDTDRARDHLLLKARLDYPGQTGAVGVQFESRDTYPCIMWAFESVHRYMGSLEVSYTVRTTKV